MPDEPVWFEADEGQIKQIVWNLATNGVRAMPNGGRLRLAASTNDDGVVMTVSDRAVGIAPDDIDGLFQPFQGSFAKGSGLGLAIVHRIVTDYRGEIRIDSTPAREPRFQCVCPARAKSA